MIKKIILFLANSLLSFGLLLAVTAAVLLAVFNADNIKKWLSEGKVYTDLVPALLDEAEARMGDSSEGDTTNPLTDPGVQAAAEKALSPAFLQASTEEVIDSIDDWLKGQVDTPTFTIDLAEVKNSFATDVGDYASQRYASLPECATGQIPDTTDVLKVTCKVGGYDPAADIQQAVDDLKNSKDFLADTTITAEDIVIGDEGDKQPVFQRLEDLPRAMRAVSFLPYVLGVFTAGAAMVVLSVSDSRRRGVKTIASTIIPVGLVLFLEAWLLSVGIERWHRQVTSSADASGLERVAVNGMRGLGDDLWRSVMTFAVIITLVGLGLVIGLLVTRHKSLESTIPDAANSTDGAGDSNVAPSSTDYRDTHQPKAHPLEHKPKEPTDSDTQAS